VVEGVAFRQTKGEQEIMRTYLEVAIEGIFIGVGFCGVVLGCMACIAAILSVVIPLVASAPPALQLFLAGAGAAGVGALLLRIASKEG
jgi:hypothetical protein